MITRSLQGPGLGNVCTPGDPDYYQTTIAQASWPFFQNICGNAAQIACSALPPLQAAKCMLGLQPDPYTLCSDAADQDPQYAALNAIDLSGWSPTGYYNSSDIRAIVAQQQALLLAAQSLLTATASQCSNAPGCQSGDLLGQMQYNITVAQTAAQGYLNGANQADTNLSAALAGSGYVVAPSLKDWCEQSIQAATSSVHAALVVQCMMPSWASGLANVVQLTTNFASLVGTIAGVAADVVQTAVAAGKAVGNVAASAFDLLGWFSSNMPLVIGVVGLGLVGLFAYKRRDRIKAYFARPGSPAVAGFGDYEVHHGGRVYMFPTAKRARAQAKLLEHEYGGRARVTGLNGSKRSLMGYTAKQRAAQAEIKLDQIPHSQWSRARVTAVLREIDTEALREIAWTHRKGAGIFAAGRQVAQWADDVLHERGA
jgi:hypothetical protein